MRSKVKQITGARPWALPVPAGARGVVAAPGRPLKTMLIIHHAANHFHSSGRRCVPGGRPQILPQARNVKKQFPSSPRLPICPFFRVPTPEGQGQFMKTSMARGGDGSSSFSHVMQNDGGDEPSPLLDALSVPKRRNDETVTCFYGPFVVCNRYSERFPCQPRRGGLCSRFVISRLRPVHGWNPSERRAVLP